MKIRIRYENQVTTIDIPEEEFEVMIQLDYEQRLVESNNPSAVTLRTPQEIMDERFNRPDYNNWHRYWRNVDDNAVPQNLRGQKQHRTSDMGTCNEPTHYTMDEFPDFEAIEKRQHEDDDEALREWIREQLKPEYAEMLIAIHMDGMSLKDYADQIGIEQSNASHRLKRAERKFREITGKRHIWACL